MADVGNEDGGLIATPGTPRMGKTYSLNDFIYTDDNQPWQDEEHRTSLILAGECRALLRAYKDAPPGMVSPTGFWRVRWELFMHFLIVFQSIVVPFELAFLPEYLMATHGGWFVFEVFVLLAFLLDMILTFRTGILQHGKIEFDPRAVAWNYICSWFPLDFFAWLPSVMALVVPADDDAEEGRSTAVARLGKSVKFVRVVRILRVLQIARIARLRRMVQGVQMKLLHSELFSQLLESLGLGLVVFITLHLIACLWGVVAPMDAHLVDYHEDSDAASTGSRYLLALWWASCALTFGGQPPPKADGERVLTVFVNLASVAVVALVMAWFASLVLSRASEKKELVHKLNVASRFASAHELPHELSMEVKHSIQHAQHSKQVSRDFKDVVEAYLSQDLCQRVHGWVHGHLLRRFPPFSEEAADLFPNCTAVSDRFLAQLAFEAKITTFMAGDRVATIGEKAETMVFVLEGSLLMMGPAIPTPQILREKYWFGEPVLIFAYVRNNEDNFRWTSRSSTRAASIVALANCKLLEIGQDSFNDAVKQHGLLQNWLRPVINFVESEQGTLGCSCCRQLDHWVTQCPEAQTSPLKRLHIARREARVLSSEVGPERPRWLPRTGPGNMQVPPEMWGMRLRQWAAFIVACCFTEKWTELEESTVHGKEAGHVNLYQVCEHMVKPWTRGTGNSVALLMNNAEPLKAEVMVSHAWGESILETLVAVLSKASVLGITLDTIIWFCTFAQYQPGNLSGDCGPTVEQQLALDPFKRVIESRPAFGMLVVHTSTAELYSRLWCVYEVNEAKESDVLPFSAYSMRALKVLQDLDDSELDLEEALKVDTSKAACWSADDDERIRKAVEAGGGFEQLDQTILAFRLASVATFHGMFAKFVDWAGSGAQEQSTFQGLSQVVRHAGVFVGLHCLAPYVEQTRDTELAVKLMAKAKESLKLWTQTFTNSAKAPPCLDPSKIRHHPDPSNDEQVQACLLDLRHFPFATGLLEMAGGGNLPALLRHAVGLDAKDPTSTLKIQKAFTRWTGSSQKMERSDLAQLLPLVGMEHLEPDLDHQFALADRNGDGLIDFLEFEAWLQRGLV